MDMLINNAGVTDGFPLAALKARPEPFTAAFDTILIGELRVTQAFINLVKKSPALRIVMISSSQGSLTVANDPKGKYYHYKGAVYHRPNQS